MTIRSTAILHCAAVSSNWHVGKTAAEAVNTIRGWHLQNGWKDIGYHYVIMPDGSVASGRPYDQDGAHTSGHNKNTVGILLVENVRVTAVKTFDHYFTSSQRTALKALLKGLRVTSVKGHNDYAAKLCPGFTVKTEDWL